jgi:hypothetical protein
MIYKSCTFLNMCNLFSLLKAYFLPTYRNGTIPVLGKLSYTTELLSIFIGASLPWNLQY